MCASIDSTLEAPAIVRCLVSKSRWLQNALQQDDSAHEVFAEAACRSQQEIKQYGVAAVSCSCRLSQYPSLSEEEQARESQTLEPASALQEIFVFYKTLQPPGSQLARKGLSYEEISGCNETMSFFETLWFCRNFNVVPALISKNDLLQIWRELVVLRLFEERDRDPVCTYGLNLRMFVGFLGVLAVAVAHDPTSRRALFGATAHGKKLTLEDKCLRLAAYLHLDDVRQVRQRLQSVGRATVAALNFRSRGEKSGKDSSSAPSQLGSLGGSARRLSVATEASHSSSEVNSFSEVEEGDIAPTHIRKHAYLQSSLFDECWQYLEPFVYGRKVHAVVTGGPCIDLGTVVHGWNYRFRIEITNLVRNEIAITSISQEGIHPDSVSFTYLPEGFASGIVRVVDVDITVQDDVGDDILGLLTIRLSQVGGLRASQSPLEPTDITVVVSYRVLPENLAHLSRPGKQLQPTSLISVAAGATAKPTVTVAVPSRAADTTIATRPCSATPSRRPTASGDHPTQRRPLQSARRYRERAGILDLGDTATSTIFHRLHTQANRPERGSDKRRPV